MELVISTTALSDTSVLTVLSFLGVIVIVSYSHLLCFGISRNDT